MNCPGPMQKPSSLVLLGALLAVSACARPNTAVSPPTPIVAPPLIASGLPAVPTVRGAPIDVRVRYPAENQLITSRDSNFVLGSLGTGDATLSINGQAVPVAPNGAFLAWLPNPPAGALR